MPRRPTRSFAAAWLLIAAFAACAPATPAADVLRIGIEGNPTNLDPRFAADAYSTRIVGLVYEGLLTDTPDGGVAPLLAESWEQTNDRTYRFVLRSDAVWQDGAPVTAADAVATYRFLADPKNACPAQEVFGRVEDIETPTTER